MQDYFCPRCGRRMPDGHCSYCENRPRRTAYRSTAYRSTAYRSAAYPSADGSGNSAGDIKQKAGAALTEEKIISFDSIKDSGGRKTGRPRSMGGGKQDIVLNFIDLEEEDRSKKKKAVPEDGTSSGYGRKAPEPKRSAAAGCSVARWFSERVEAIKRFADELINPEEE